MRNLVKRFIKDQEATEANLKSGSANGNADSTFKLGYIKEHQQSKYDEAVQFYRLAAHQGQARAYNSLGLMYEHGRGVAKDYDEAARLYSLAAAQGNARGQYKLGMMYEHGRGVEQDDAEAVRLYRIAAEQRHADAAYRLAKMYEKMHKDEEEEEQQG